MTTKIINGKKIYLDEKYDNLYMGKMINNLMIGGKKEQAKLIFYKAVEYGAHINKMNPVEFFEACLENIKSTHNFMKIKLGASVREAPYLVSQQTQLFNGIKRMVRAMRTLSKTKNMKAIECLKEEFINAFNKKGISFNEKEEYDKKIELNKIYAHLTVNRIHGDNLQRITNINQEKS